MVKVLIAVLGAYLTASSSSNYVCTWRDHERYRPSYCHFPDCDERMGDGHRPSLPVRVVETAL